MYFSEFLGPCCCLHVHASTTHVTTSICHTATHVHSHMCTHVKHHIPYIMAHGLTSNITQSTTYAITHTHNYTQMAHVHHSPHSLQPRPRSDTPGSFSGPPQHPPRGLLLADPIPEPELIRKLWREEGWCSRLGTAGHSQLREGGGESLFLETCMSRCCCLCFLWKSSFKSPEAP